MIEIRAVYQFIFNYDLSGYTTREENGITYIQFKSKQEVGAFLKKHGLRPVDLSGTDTTVLVNRDENIYGQLLVA